MLPSDIVNSYLPYYREVILYYKVNPCVQRSQQTIQCTQQGCFNYHNIQERRRPIFIHGSQDLLYQPVLCSALIESGTCNNGDSCPYSHTANEIRYHPLYYKTKPCINCQSPNLTTLCPAYHSDEVDKSILIEKPQQSKIKKHKNPNPQQASKPSTSQRKFDLSNFKTKPCPSKGPHNPKVCTYYHSDQDRRRPYQVIAYSPEICPYISNKKECPNGDYCRFSHNKVEQLYHPDKYKKKFCLCHPHNIHKCKYSNYCSFAHNEQEIKVKLLHNSKKDENFYVFMYKTVFCPYIYEHDRNQCVYAHNPQDFRRDPRQYNYGPQQCPNWSQGQIQSYEEGKCPKGMNCENCHGWKELEYHPLRYKTQHCGNGDRCTKRECPFLHENSNKKGNEETGNQMSMLEKQMKDALKISSSPQNERFNKEPNFYFDEEFKAMQWRQNVNSSNDKIPLSNQRNFQENIERPNNNMQPNFAKYHMKNENKAHYVQRTGDLMSSLSLKSKPISFENPMKPSDPFWSKPNPEVRDSDYESTMYYEKNQNTLDSFFTADTNQSTFRMSATKNRKENLNFTNPPLFQISDEDNFDRSLSSINFSENILEKSDEELSDSNFSLPPGSTGYSLPHYPFQSFKREDDFPL